MINKKMILSTVAAISNEAGEIEQEVFAEMVEGLTEADVKKVLDVISSNHFSIVEENVVNSNNNHVGSHCGLSNEELCKRYQKGDKDALEALCINNKNLVRKFANKTYRNFNLPEIAIDDLCSMGNIGLMMAADKFKPSLGYKFSTYATYWIQREINREAINIGYGVKIPTNKYWHTLKAYRLYDDDCKSISEIREYLLEKHGKAYSESEIKDMLSYKTKYFDMSSLDETLGDEEDDAKRSDLYAGTDNTEEEAIRRVDSEMLEKLLVTTLSEKENAILHRRFGMGGNGSETLEAVAKDYGVSKERIRQIAEEALARLRTPEILEKLEGMLAA